MTLNHLNRVFYQVNRKFSKSETVIIDAAFYPFKSIKHTIRWSGKHIYARISDQLRNAPHYILEIVAHLLLSKLYNRRPQKRLRQIYLAYCSDVIAPKPHMAKGYKPEGIYYDLRERFVKINSKFFDSRLKVETIGWSKKKSLTRLAFYDRNRDLLVISSVFDNSSVPPEIIDYLLYHEMLHIIYPVIYRNGRRVVHSAEFRKDEKKFPDYIFVKKWLEKFLKSHRKMVRSF